jgi:hypothetical protein
MLKEVVVLGVLVIILFIFAYQINHRFYKALKNLKPGQDVTVKDPDNCMTPYRVVRVCKNYWIGERVYSVDNDNGSKKRFRYDQIFSISNH